MNTHDQIASILKAALDLSASSRIEPQQRLKEDLAINSLKLVTVLTELCDVFGIDVGSFSVTDIRALEHVSDLTSLVERETHA